MMIGLIVVGVWSMDGCWVRLKVYLLPLYCWDIDVDFDCCD